MGASYELSATAREKVGKGAARSVRREGKVPAVIYGGSKPPVAISLPYRDIYFKIHGGGFFTTVATIDVAGEKIRAIPRDYQIDPVSDRPQHVDFLRIVEGSRLTVDIPVQFVNDSAAPGIRRGGVLNVVRHRISVECLADNIPEKIVVDLTGLDIGSTIRVSDLKAPGEATIALDGETVVASVAGAMAEVAEEAPAAEGAEGEEAAAPAEGEASEGGEE